MLLRRFSRCSTPVNCYLFKTYYSNLYCCYLGYNSTVNAMKKLKLPITTALDDYFVYINIIVQLSICFTCMFKHCILFTGMLNSVIVPLVKNA